MRSLSLNVGGVDLVAMIGERDGEDMVAVKPICEALGLSWSRQQKKLSNGAERLRCSLMAIPSAGGIQNMLCIPIKKVAAWLFTINPNKVKERYKAAVIAFQDELQHALYAYVKGDLTFEMVEELKKLITVLIAENAELKERVANLEKSNYHEDMATRRQASAGAHSMLAAKARRHLRSV